MHLKISLFMCCFLFLVSPVYGKGVTHEITGNGVIDQRINGNPTTFQVKVIDGSGYLSTTHEPNGSAVNYGLTGSGSTMGTVGGVATVSDTGYQVTITEPGGHAQYAYIGQDNSMAQFYLYSEEGKGELIVKHDTNAGVWASDRVWGQAYVEGPGSFYTAAEKTSGPFNFRISGGVAGITSEVKGQMSGYIETTVKGNKIDYQRGFRVILGPGVTEEAGFDFDFKNRDPGVIRSDN